MGDSTRLTWMNNTPANAPRINDDVWDQYREIMVKKYEGNTLEYVMKYMEDNFGFKATKRQYIHRIGSKWKIKKYNKPADGGEGGGGETSTSKPRQPRKKPLVVVKTETQPSEPPRSIVLRVSSPQPREPTYGNHVQTMEPFMLDLSTPHADFWYKSLADILHSLGDHQSAFQIQDAIYEKGHELPVALLCARTAQVEWQVEKVRDIIENAINRFPVPDGSWTKFLFSAQAAHYWGQTGDETNSSEQFAQLVDDCIDTSTSRIREPLTPRSPNLKLDITVYRYLYRTVLYYNSDQMNFFDQEPRLDTDKILSQFLGQQPAGRALQRNGNNDLLSDISCLPACLKWCIEILERDSLQEISNAPDSPVFNISCMLWRIWIQSRPEHTFREANTKDWSDEAMDQLDMSPSELIVIVVCMIMATERDDDTYHTQFNAAPNARDRARTLESMGRRALLDRFLQQIRETTKKQMSTTRTEHLEFSEFLPFRRFIGNCAPVQLPAVPGEAVNHPPTIARLDRADDLEHRQPHPVSGYTPAGLTALSPPVDPDLSLYQYGQSPGGQDNWNGFRED